MLNVDAMPELRELGSVGTADLPALAGTALAMLGERTVSAPLEPLAEIGADSALPFMSSSALTIARAALLIHHLDALLRAQSSVFLLSAAGARAQPDAFSLAAARAIPSDTVSALARTIATIRAQSTWQARRIQDPYAFRAFLGAYDVLNGAGERLRECVEKLMNIAQENPLFSAGTPQVLHHGAFHQAHLAHELDATALALAQSASLAVSRIRFLNDDAITGLPRFLAPNAGGSSGTMIVEYVAASAMGDILAASSPVSMYSTVLSCGLEDDATFATTSVRKLEQAVSGYETLLAAELLVAVRAIRLVPPHDLVLDGPLLNVWASADAALPKSMADRDLRGDLESARELVITLGGGSAATDC
jgi:histidine ammonia-lyase